MKKLLQKTMAVLLAANLAAGCAVPALAAGQSGVQKDETAYLILNQDGSVRQQIVSDWLHSDSGLKNVRDKSSLREIENLKSDAMPQRTGDTLVWDVPEQDVYYQGKSESAPPLSVSITYELDGKELPAEELSGKTGHLILHASLKNNEGETMEIGGKPRTVYTPFFTVAAAMLPADSFTNVTAEHGTVQTDSKTQLACFLALPGLSETLEGLLPDSLSQLEDLLLDELVIEADVTDCPVPTFLFAASPSLEGLSGGLEDPELSGQLEELENATQQLQDGTTSLDEAVSTLMEKLAQFSDGYSEFDEGINSALSGSQQLAGGSENLLKNAELLSEKSAELAAGAAQLQDGTAQLSSLLNTQLVPGLTQAGTQEAALKAKLEELSAQLNSVSIPDFSGLKGQLSAGVCQVFDQAAYGASYNAALAVGAQLGGKLGEVKSGCEAAASGASGQVAAGIQQNYRQALAEALTQAGVDEDTQAAVLGAMDGAVSQEALSASISSSINGAIDSYVEVPENPIGEEQAGAVAGSVVAQMADAKATAAAQVASQVPSVDSAQFSYLLGEFQNLSGEASQMLDSVDVLTAALYHAENPSDPSTVVGAAGMLAVGAETLSSGASALSNGTGAFADGVEQLQSGAGSLYAGLTTLSASSKTVSGSIAQFQSGGAELKNGASQLKTGMDEYASQAVGRLVKLADPGSDLGLTLAAMQNRAEAYEGTGRDEKTGMTVKFVMRTAAPETQEPEAETAQEPASTETPPEESLWGRIKGLFA